MNFLQSPDTNKRVKSPESRVDVGMSDTHALVGSEGVYGSFPRLMSTLVWTTIDNGDE